MTSLKVLTVDAVNEIDAEFVDGRVVTDARGITVGLGWEPKPEGLCRGDRCVPVRDDARIEHDGGYDLGRVAAVLDMATLVDADRSLVAVSAPAGDRRLALKGRTAPDFTLPDLDGVAHSLEEFKDRKRLLIAFASW